jgi:hypothetical protein
MCEIDNSDPGSIGCTSSLLSTPSIVYITDVESEAASPIFFTNADIVTTSFGFGFIGSVEMFSNIRLEFGVLFVEFPPSPNCPSAADTIPGINPGIITNTNNTEIKEFKK